MEFQSWGLLFLGKQMINFVPLPTTLSKVTVPPKASVMRLTTAKPKPCPFDLVVKSGVNKFAFCFFRYAHARVLNSYNIVFCFSVSLNG